MGKKLKWGAVGIVAIVLVIVVAGVVVAALSGDDEGGERIREGRTLIVFLDGGGEPSMTIEASAGKYDEAKSILLDDPTVQDSGFGFTVRRETYAKLLALFDLGPEVQATKEAWNAEQAARDALWNRDWSIAELADCTGHLEATVCEAVLMYRQLETIQAIRELPPDDRVKIDSITINLGKIDQAGERFVADGTVDAVEEDVLCTLVPQWLAQIQDAEKFIGSLGRSDLQGLEIDIYRRETLARGMSDICDEQEIGLGLNRDRSANSTSTPEPTSTPVTETSTAKPSSGTDVPSSISSGEVSSDQWYEASARCARDGSAQWTDEIWQDTALVYLGSEIVIGIANTKWSLPPDALLDYRDFLNGSGAFAVDDWSGLFATHKWFRDNIGSGTRVLASGSIIVNDLVVPSFPHAWLAEYRDAVPRLEEMSSAGGELLGSIVIPQDGHDSPLKTQLGLFRNRFNCRTAEMQE